MLSEIYDPEFGYIEVTFRRGMRRIVAYSIGCRIKISAPYHCSEFLLQEHIETFRQDLRNQINKHRPDIVHFSDGQSIICSGGFYITISSRRNLIKLIKQPNGLILVPKDIDMDAEWVKKEISIRIKRMLKDRFYILSAMAEKIAAELNVLNVKRFVVGRGTRKLGHCTADGEIQLSYMLLLLPNHLARYVICHELAHLTHLNHSEAFHQLCNTYVGGMEKLYEAELRCFQWPIVR